MPTVPPSSASAADLDGALAIAREVVAEAVALVRGKAPTRVSGKSNPRDLVTEWDHRLEEVIRERLAVLSPGVPIVGEEGGGDAKDARWLIDPIDGTVNFAHGLALWGVTVALEDGGRPIAGVVSAPMLGWEMYARGGGGGFVVEGGGAPVRLKVSPIGDLEQAMLSTGFPYDRAESRHNFAEWDHLQVVAGAVRRLGAASVDLALVARGVLDGYWESHLSPWDVSAGALLVEEAGGRVTDVAGGPFRSDDGSVLATNGPLHPAMLAALAAARAG